jgi:putative oxidoreductase
MNTLQSWAPKVLSLLRFVSGLTFLEHGAQKVFNFPPPPASLAHPPPHAPSLADVLRPAAGPIELVCGVLLMLGLFTRSAAFLCSGEMALGYFLVHVKNGGPFPTLNGGDPAILFCFIFLYLVFAGPGPYSLDALMRKKA